MASYGQGLGAQIAANPGINASAFVEPNG